MDVSQIVEQNEQQLKNQNDRITKLVEDIKELKNRDDVLKNFITVKEAFIALEKYMMVEITGSKTKAREYYGLKDLFKDQEIESKCNTYLSKYCITRDHIFLIPDIKDIGNISVFTSYPNKGHRAHANRPLVKRNDWNDFALTTISDTQNFDQNEKEMVKDLLKLLEIYNPVGAQDWLIKKPYQ